MLTTLVSLFKHLQDPYYLFAYYYTNILNQMSMNLPHMNRGPHTCPTILYLCPAARDQMGNCRLHFFVSSSLKRSSLANNYKWYLLSADIVYHLRKKGSRLVRLPSLILSKMVTAVGQLIKNLYICSGL